MNSEYPCPCRRRGRLLPITLTEAFGCDRCQQLFVVEENGQVLEQLSTGYPYKRSWRWTGYRWITAQSNLKKAYMPLVLGILIIIIVMAVWGLGNLSGEAIKTVLLTLALLISLLITIWLTYRR